MKQLRSVTAGLAVAAVTTLGIGSAQAETTFTVLSSSMPIEGSSGLTCKQRPPAVLNAWRGPKRGVETPVPAVYCGSTTHSIIAPRGYRLDTPVLTGCELPDVADPVIDQHVVLTLVDSVAVKGLDDGVAITFVVGDRLDGRVQTYCVRVTVTAP